MQNRYLYTFSTHVNESMSRMNSSPLNTARLRPATQAKGDSPAGNHNCVVQGASFDHDQEAWRNLTPVGWDRKQCSTYHSPVQNLPVNGVIP